MADNRWLVYALISAVAASFVGIFGKLGMSHIDSTVATAVRSVVMTVFLVGLVSVAGLWSGVRLITGWPLVWVVGSGLAGAISWLFYFKAIQAGGVAKVAPIDKLSMPLAVLLAVLLLHEKFSWPNWLGVGLIVLGAALTALP